MTLLAHLAALVALVLVLTFTAGVVRSSAGLSMRRRLTLARRGEFGAATTQQVAPAQEAGRPQPQTTVEPAGGPFIRYAQPGKRRQFTVTGQAFGGLITQPLVAVPGYVRKYRVRVAATGGSASATTGAAILDAPFNIASLVTLKDAFGTPLIVAPGWEAFYAIPKYSGGHGLLSAADIKNMPTFSAIASASGASAGNFTFATALPLEFAKGYGVISGANASLLPTLQIQLNAAASLYTTVPGTLPTMQVDIGADFYWLPEGVDIVPPGLGSTRQWVLQQCNPTIGSASTATVSLPRMGGFIDTLILILRDSTGVRVDSYGTTLRFYVDGVPLVDARFDELQDDLFNEYGGITRDTGVMVISRKTSLGQLILGLFDTLESTLSTNPGTLLQIECSPWGTISNAPATLSVLAGQIVPSGSLIQGLPEL